MSDLYGSLQKKYSLSKTLRFELKPVGKTLEYINENGVVSEDEHRAQSYKYVKKYCDEYHKFFINECLEKFEFSSNLLDEYYLLYKKENKSIEERQKQKDIETKLRQEVSDCFTKNDKFDSLFGKDMIQKYLIELYKSNEEKINQIMEFQKFTTYFSGFNINRKKCMLLMKKVQQFHID